MRTVFRVMPDAQGHGWQVIRDGTGMGLFTTRADAVSRASVQAKSARPSHVVICDEDGRMESEQYYGADEAPPEPAE